MSGTSRSFRGGFLAAALAAVLVAGLPRAAAAADPFYLNLLADGTQAYDAGDFPTAARQLRVACFGLLETPPLLGGCLVRLALAQAQSADEEGFRETFRRLAEVEERFQGYRQADLPPALSTAFEQRVEAKIPAATLAAVPALQSLLAQRLEARLAAMPPKQRRAELQKRIAAEPKNPRWPALLARLELADKRPPASAPAPPAQASAAIPPAAVPATPLPSVAEPAAAAPAAAAGLSANDRGTMAKARSLLGPDASVRDLRRALQLAREVADARREATEAQLLAAEAAYRNSRWEDAATYFRRAGDLDDEKPEMLFYRAVAYYESGDREAAADSLRRSLPNLQRTQFVDRYAKKILGEGPR